MKRIWKFLAIVLVPVVVYLTAFASGVRQAFYPAFSALLIVLLPLVLGDWFVRRFRLSWGLFGAGAVTFIASQVGHIPFNSYVLNPLLAKMGIVGMPTGSKLLVVGALLGLSAGVFEETARYITMRWWRKDVRSWGESLMLGAGHGGIEAILVGVYAVYILTQMITLHGLDLETVSALAGPERAAEVFGAVTVYWSSPWYDFFWSFLERVSAVAFHLSASVLVYQCFRRKNLLWLGAAIVWHALLDAVAVVGVSQWGVAAVEGALFAMALLGVGIIFALREQPAEPQEEHIDEPDEFQGILTNKQMEIKITTEKLDESRYD